MDLTQHLTDLTQPQIDLSQPKPDLTWSPRRDGACAEQTRESRSGPPAWAAGWS